MKKFLSALLTSAMLVTACAGMTGCGKKSSGGTLKWVQFGDKQPRTDEIIKKVNEIVEPELGLKVEVEFIDSASFKEKSKMKMAASEDYDVIWAGYLNDYQSAVSLGGFYDITDYLDNIKMKDGKTVKMSDVVEDYFLDAAKVDGKIYGIPNTQVISNPFVSIMPKSVADECGVDAKALEDTALKVKDKASAQAYMDVLTAELGKIKAKRPDLYTVNPGTNFAYKNVYEEIVGGVGIRKDGSSDKVVIINDTDEFKCGIDAARTWFEKGYIRSDIAGKGNAVTSNEEKKQYGMLQSTWKPGQEVQDENDYGEPVVYARFENPYVSRTNPLATMLAVGKDSRHPEEAVKFIYMLNSNKELYNLICWGEEGVDYKKNDDGTITEIKDSGYDDVGATAWRYGNQFNSFVVKGQDLDVWDKTREMNDNAIKSPAMGFVPDTDPITTEIANITNVNSEYKAKIEFGTSARADYWDGYMKKLKDAGIEKVQKEIQKQYSAFLKKQK